MANHGHVTPHHDPRQPLVGHLVGIPILAATALALLLLTAITVYTATNIDLGPLNIWIALFIAVIKGSLVCLYFMHLRWDRPFNIVIFVGCLAFVALFIGLLLTDSVAYQGDLVPPTAKEYAPNITRMK
jgi:cytochrome c oxidase subunit 4